jgi:hypothetical protein
LGFGGIHDASGQCYLTNCTVAFNACTGASYGPGSYSCGGIMASGAAMVNTLLAQNLPGGNCLGVITDLGHNMSSETVCGFTNATSINNAYAFLGPLTNNGGPADTIALLPGSPAIDAGDTAAAPPTDQRGVPRPFGLAADIGAYEYNSPTNPRPSTVVTECTEAALRAAMSGGGTVTFACDGTITLSNTLFITDNTVLDATDHQITISGGNVVRVFYVNTNVAFAVANLAVANGQAPSGGAILNAGGLVKATNCAFSGNHTTPGVLARGGAIRNDSGDVYLSACVFTTNQASGATGANGLSGGSAWGGALDNSGTLTADLCSFIANSALGADGLAGGTLYNGIPGGSGGDSVGGAICNFGTLTISRSTFTNNSAIGGTGAPGGDGRYGEMPGQTGGLGGDGGSGGGGKGGAIYCAAPARVVNTTFAFNLGTGANGGSGGYGNGSHYGPGGNGGNGGTGGDGAGAVSSSGDFQLINCTFASNSGSAGNGDAGGAAGYGTSAGHGGSGGNGGSGFGAVDGTCHLTNCTVAWNLGHGGSGGSGSPSGTNGAAWGGTACGPLVNTLIASNTPPDGDSFADPKLGPLADNGGPTLTMALLSGSPAIDAGDTSAAPATDQRGFPRPAGLAADIGAFEYGSVMPTIAVSRSGTTGLNILGSGNAGQSCRLLSSTDLSSWVPMATNQFDTNGTILFHDNYAPGSACRFYRLVMP